MTTTEAVAKLVDVTVEAILGVDPGELPLHGRHWTLRLADRALLLRIRAVNNTPQPRTPPVEPPPPPPEEPPGHGAPRP